jgi:hypothetical protein
MKANVVKPIALATEWNVRPQYVYALMREGKLVAHECECGHKYLLRTEVDAFVAAKKAKTA